MPPEEIALNPSVRDDESALLRALLQATDYGILMTGLDRQDMIANRRLGEMFDLTPQQIVEMDPQAVRALARTRFRDPVAFEELLEEIYADPDLVREDELELAGDAGRTVRRFTAPVRNGRQEPIGRLWTFLDVTETRRLQAEVQAQLAARTDDLHRTSQVLQAMNDLCRLAASERSPSELLQDALERIRPLLGDRAAALLMAGEDPAVLRGACGRAGAREQPVEVSLRDEPLLQDFLTGRKEGGEALPCCRVRTGALPALLGAGAVAIAPLQAGERPFGLIAFSVDEVGDDLNGLEAAHARGLVDQVALALEAHRLQAELRAALAALRAAQRQMVEIERLRVAGSLASSVAGDIRNILTPVQVELAAQPDAVPEAVHDQLNRFFALTHQLLSFSRPGILDTCPTPLPGVIRRVVPLVARQAEISGVRIAVELPESLPPALADGAQLEHLFVNLCLNALQAMAETGGTLTLTGRALDGWVEVSVRDTGPGIAAGDQERIFEPFFSRRANGLGLGLFSCKRIVEDHGGELRVASPPGEGACFTVRLPAALEGSADGSPPARG
jgi:signal transduction histidine kinase